MNCTKLAFNAIIYIQGMQHLEHTNAGSEMNKSSSVGASGSESPVESALVGKPKRYNTRQCL